MDEFGDIHHQESYVLVYFTIPWQWYLLNHIVQNYTEPNMLLWVIIIFVSNLNIQINSY